MGIDMELMRRKLASLRGEGNKDSSSPWFKPDEGDTDIRIVPTNDGDPLKEMFFHYNVGEHKGGIYVRSVTSASTALYVNLLLRFGARE